MEQKEAERFSQVFAYLKDQGKIRTREEFAQKLGITVQELGRVLNHGKGASLKILQSLIDNFNVNANFLFREDPQMFYINSESKPPGASDAGIITVSVDEGGNENVLFVPARAHASYISAFTDPVYLKDMIAFKAPFLSYHGVRVFEVKGNSMEKPSGEGIHEGDSLWCTQTYKYQDIHNGRVHVVWTDDTAYVKRVTWNEGNDYLSLRSDNPETKTFRLPISEVRQIWYAHVHFNFHMPPPGTVDAKLSEFEIRLSDQEKSLLKLMNQIKGLLGGNLEL